MPTSVNGFDRDCISPGKCKASKRSPKSVGGLVNARLLALEFETFETPTNADIRKVKPGDFVKLARNGERFWVRVSGFVGKKWHGIVDNDLSMNPDLQAGDCIFFDRKNIYDILRR
jgi:hypothetical protein